MRVAHDLRLTLRAYHHAAAVLALQSTSSASTASFSAGSSPAHARAAPGLDQEVDVERDGAALRRPRGELTQLGAVAARDGRLDNEVERCVARRSTAASVSASAPSPWRNRSW
jgi:hypothetical protein